MRGRCAQETQSLAHSRRYISCGVTTFSLQIQVRNSYVKSPYRKEETDPENCHFSSWILQSFRNSEMLLRILLLYCFTLKNCLVYNDVIFLNFIVFFVCIAKDHNTCKLKNLQYYFFLIYDISKYIGEIKILLLI